MRQEPVSSRNQRKVEVVRWNMLLRLCDCKPTPISVRLLSRYRQMVKSEFLKAVTILEDWQFACENRDVGVCVRQESMTRGWQTSARPASLTSTEAPLAEHAAPPFSALRQYIRTYRLPLNLPIYIHPATSVSCTPTYTSSTLYIPD